MSRGFSSTAAMSTKGQLTIPRRFRRALGWRTGDHLLVEPRSEDCFTMRKVSPTLGRAIRDYGRSRRRLSPDEVLLLALLADPATTEAAILAHVRRLRHRERKEASPR